MTTFNKRIWRRWWWWWWWDIKSLESVQRKFTKRLSEIKTELIVKLWLESLELWRRLRADLLSLVFGTINLKLSDFLFLIFTDLAAASLGNYIYLPVKAVSDLTATAILTEFCVFGTNPQPSVNVQSCNVHPCEVVRHCPVLQRPSLRCRPSLSSPALCLSVTVTLQ